MADDDLQRQIAALRALRAAATDPAQCAALDAALAALQGTAPPLIDAGDPAARDVYKGTIDVGDQARLYGPAVGLNLGTIIYGRDPRDDERRRLVWYLEGLARKLAYLPLRGLDEGLSRGEQMELPRVYVALAVQTRVEAVRGRASRLRAYFERDDPTNPLKQEYDPDYALPDTALFRGDGGRDIGKNDELILQRALTALEAVQRRARLALLGEPGSGKSTFVRYLAWALALHELDPSQAPSLPGWDGEQPRLPVLMPLRTLAGRIARDGCGDQALYAALRDELEAYCTHDIDDALSAALSRGAALLLFDGLDEVPPTATATAADRLTTLQAVRSITWRYRDCPAVVTCRVRAFDDDLRAELGWQVETLDPFTLGQIRHFTSAWYNELVAKGQIDRPKADRLGAALIAAILDPARPRLRSMAGTPLLLTLMALVLYNKGELPRDRPQLYERILELLLGQWDQMRDGQSLGQAIGKPEWDSSYIRPLLDRLSYRAHADATSADGRGRLARGAVYAALIDFFRQVQVDGPGDAALRCLDYFEQRSGLLAPDVPDSYVFAHLTLQEHCAGREIAVNADDPVAVVLGHRADDRWREPIMLGMGLVQPLVLDRLLNDLLEREEGGAAKPVERWYRDLILAAEIGADRDWTYLRTRPQVRVERFRQALRRGLADLLGDATQPLPVAERVRAGFLLGNLGDPRLLDPDAGNAPDERYWRPVAAGDFWYGDDRKGDLQPVALAYDFQIARFPVTNAEFDRFIAAGGYAREEWWTAQGWKWRLPGGHPYSWEDNERPIHGPWLQNDSRYNAPTQPVVGVSWYEAAAYCLWLTARGHAQGWLPDGEVIRLPTSLEWERAARGDDRRHYPWGTDAPTPEHANYEETGIGRPAPVGCFPRGAAPCGAEDMAGNVWEWMATPWGNQMQAAPEKDFTLDSRVVISWSDFSDSEEHLFCGARFRNFPGSGNVFRGFRVIQSLALIK